MFENSGTMYANLTSDAGAHRQYYDDGLPLQNRRTTFLGVVIPFLILTWFAVAFRLHTRFFTVHAPGYDDLFIVLALLTASASAISLSLSTNYGLGHPSDEVSQDDKETFFKLFYIANAVFTMSNTFVKLSLLAQYIRIFAQDRMKKVCQVAFAIISLWGLTYSFFAWIPCFPPSEFWVVGVENHCYGYGAKDPYTIYRTTVSATASNMAFDIIIWSLPIYLLFRFDTQRKTKTGLLMLLLIGVIIISIAAARVVANRATSKPRPDPFWDFPIILLLGETENRLACILGSIPIFWPVMQKTLYRIFVTYEFSIQSSHRLPHDHESVGTVVCNPSTGEIVPNASGTTAASGIPDSTVAEMGMAQPKHVSFVLPEESPSPGRGLMDPLRFDDTAVIESAVTIEGPSRKPKPWQIGTLPF